MNLTRLVRLQKTTTTTTTCISKLKKGYVGKGTTYSSTTYTLSIYIYHTTHL